MTGGGEGETVREPNDDPNDVLLAFRPETAAERAVLAIAREAVAHQGRVGRRTHASALYVASPAGTVTVEAVGTTPEGLVRFVGQLHSRAAAAVVVAPEAIVVAFAVKPTRDLRTVERNIGANIARGLSLARTERKKARKDAKQHRRAAKMLKAAAKNTKKAKKAAKSD